MYKGMYVGVSGAVANQKRLDVIANNLANVNTTAFKADRLLFESYLAKNERPLAAGEAAIDRRPESEYVVADTTYTELTPGAARTTGNPLDVSIDGDGFFAVMTHQGERYTRAGDFTVGPGGELTTKAGHMVLSDTNEPIFVNDGEVTINGDGEVWVRKSFIDGQAGGNPDDMTGRLKGRIKLVDFDKPYTLKKVGAGVYDANGAPANAECATKLQSGMLETSNVSTIREMTSLITNQRSFEALQKTISEHDQMTSQLLIKVARPA